MAQRQTSWVKVVAILIYINQHQLSKAHKHFTYMTNYCSMSIQVDGSLLLDFAPLEDLPDDRTAEFVHCDVDLLAPEDMKLFAHFLLLEISPVPSHSDGLHLFNLTPQKVRLTPIKGLYGKLDRKHSIFDESGSKVKDYTTTGNKLKVEYLGKPTKENPGFRLVITPFQDPASSGECPHRNVHCRRAVMCIGSQTVCDRIPNCGTDDDGDEHDCDNTDTVTNLLVEYSLTRDIIVVIMLPLAVFIVVVLVTLLVTRRYISTKIEKPQILKVQFTHGKEGQGDDELYEDIIDLCTGYDPPPAYNRLVSSVKKGIVGLEDGTTLLCIYENEELEHAPPVASEEMLTSSKFVKVIEEKLDSSNYNNHRQPCVWPSFPNNEELTKKGINGQIMRTMTENLTDTDGHVLCSFSQCVFLLGEDSFSGRSASGMSCCDSVSPGTAINMNSLSNFSTDDRNM